MEERKGLKQLNDCFPLLMSEDWKKRLIGEYWETKIRCAALQEEIERRTEEEHKWNESMEHHIMSRQLSDMLGYLTCLGQRATEHDIDLMDTETSESECFISISENEKMTRVQLDGLATMCVRALLSATTKTLIRLKKEERPMEKFMEDSINAFAENLCKAAEEENGCK